MKLKELQREVVKSLMHPLTRNEGMKKKDKQGKLLHTSALKLIKPNDRLTSFERLEIYNRQYWFRLLGCFYEDFPGLRAVMGDRPFEKMAEAYLRENPSRSFTMRHLGRELYPWLKKNKKWIRTCYELALDMVALEWAHMEAFDAEGKKPLSADDLLDQRGALKLKLQPYVQLLELSYPVDDFVLALRKNGDRGFASNAVQMRKKNQSRKEKFKPQALFLAVHRIDFTVYYKRLEPEAFAILQKMKEGKSLSRACEMAFSKSSIPTEERPLLVQKWFQNWSSLGWFYQS